MKKIKLGITGCLGRMGQQLIKSSKKNKNFHIISLTEIEIQNKNINGVKIEKNSEKAFKDVDVIIDFTMPKCTLRVHFGIVKSVSYTHLTLPTTPYV